MKKLRGNPKIILSIIKKDCLKTGTCIKKNKDFMEATGTTLVNVSNIINKFKKNGIIEITGVSKNRVIKLNK